MPDIRVCFLGDSFTLGQGDDAGLGWAGRVHVGERGRGLDFTSYNLGIRGQAGHEIAARAAAEIGQRIHGLGDKRGVVVSFGANDIRLDRPVEESAQSLAKILRWCAGEGYRAFVMGAPHAAEPELDALRANLNWHLEETTRRLQAPFLDIRERVHDWSTWHREAFEGDGIHPNAQGYAAVSDVFSAWQPWRSWLET
jgi:lysophospholipase L1-like esterase